MNANVRSFAGRRPAWWGNGIQKPEGWGGEYPVTDAMREIGALVDYELIPVYVNVNGMMVELPDQRALMRHDDGLGSTSASGSDDQTEVTTSVPNILQIVGKDYKVVQPDDFAASLDPVGRVMPVQTLGVLGKGEKYWVCFGGEDYEFRGDPFYECLIASDDHTGGGIRIYRSDIQIVCSNTWMQSLSSARDLITIPHTGNPAERLNFLAQLQVAVIKSRQEVMDQFEALVEFDLTDKFSWANEAVAQIIEAAFPDPAKSGRLLDFEESQRRAGQYLDHADAVVASVAEGALRDAQDYENRARRVAARRVVAAETYQRYNDEKPQFAGTGFNLVSAIIEDLDFGGVHMPGRPNSVMSGPIAKSKSRAIDTALRLAGYKRQTSVSSVN